MAQPLTDRECQVLKLMCLGMTNEEIGLELCITVKTVEYHVANILGKLGAANRTQAVVAALERGWVELGDLREDKGLEVGKDY